MSEIGGSSQGGATQGGASQQGACDVDPGRSMEPVCLKTGTSGRASSAGKKQMEVFHV